MKHCSLACSTVLHHEAAECSGPDGVISDSLFSHAIRPPADTVHWSFYATGQQDAYLCAIPTNNNIFPSLQRCTVLEKQDSTLINQSTVDRFSAAQPGSVYTVH